MLQIEPITSYDALRQYGSEWNALLAESDMDIPFMTFEWFCCWWDSFGEGNDLLVLLVREAGKLIAIAPLIRTMMNIRGINAKAVTLMANCHSLRSGFIMCKPDHHITDAVINYLRNAKGAVDLFFFDYIVKGSYTDQSLRASLANADLRFIERSADFSPYISITDSWEEFLKTKSKHFRERLKSIHNRMQRQGVFAVEEYTGNSNDAGMAQLIAVSRKTWKFGENTAIASDTRDAQFYARLASSATLKDWVTIMVLKQEKTPIAFTFNIHYKNRVFGLKMGFDHEYERFSPNKFLLSHGIKNSFDRQFTEFDLLGKNDAFKMQWTDQVRDQCRYTIFNRTVKGTILGILETTIVPRLKSYALSAANQEVRTTNKGGS
jgi:CelD/BcsL family acetyltransferase involved in cellulose biosynthesis